MGEGDPGRGVPAAFYNAARELTQSHGALLLVDSIQAGLRANGVLSIIDYPGFENAEAPDMETYSKALNAGAVPAVGARGQARAGALYRAGPVRQHDDHQSRALDVAVAVLAQLTPALRRTSASAARRRSTSSRR